MRLLLALRYEQFRTAAFYQIYVSGTALFLVDLQIADFQNGRSVEIFGVHHGGDPLQAGYQLGAFPFFQLAVFAQKAALQQFRGFFKFFQSFRGQAGIDDRETSRARALGDIWPSRRRDCIRTSCGAVRPDDFIRRLDCRSTARIIRRMEISISS